MPGGAAHDRAARRASSPVNATLSTPGWLDERRAGTSGPKPVTTLNTPGGKPASSTRPASSSVEAGVCSAGLTTTVQPAASAGASFHVSSSTGEFHGVIAADDPDRLAARVDQKFGSSDRGSSRRRSCPRRPPSSQVAPAAPRSCRSSRAAACRCRSTSIVAISLRALVDQLARAAAAAARAPRRSCAPPRPVVERRRAAPTAASTSSAPARGSVAQAAR